MGTRGIVIGKLAATNYWIRALQMTNCLHCEGLWDLTTGTESIIVAHREEAIDYKILKVKYLMQRKQIQKAIGILHLWMTDVIAVNHYGIL